MRRYPLSYNKPETEVLDYGLLYALLGASGDFTGDDPEDFVEILEEW